MCWKWRYSCGHVRDIKCRAPIKNPNDPEDSKLTYYCIGLPKDYTDAHVPCQDCNIKAAATRDDNNSKSDNDGGANHDAGRGNDSRMGHMRARGMINVNDIGSWPWDKSWMPGLVGMKYNEAGYIVDDPESTVSYTTITVRQDTYTFDSDAEYDNLSHDLEALSNNQAYANMEYEVLFRQPVDAALQYYIRNGIPAYGRVPTPLTSPVRSDAATPGSSRGSSRSASSTTLASISSAIEPEPDTPATQLSFNANQYLAIPASPVDPDFARNGLNMRRCRSAN